MADIESIKARLSNIRTVEPILSSFRTISLGSWRAALNQKRALDAYAAHLKQLLPLIVPYLETEKRGLFRGFKRRGQGELPVAGRVAVLVVGSERGLCGHFNAAVVERAKQYLEGTQEDGRRVDLMVLGSRIERFLARGGYEIAWAGAMPSTALPSLSLAMDLMQRWLTRYEVGELDRVDLIYNAYRGLGAYETTVLRLLPPDVPLAADAQDEKLTVPTIVETDPASLYGHLVEQWAVLSLHALLLDSAAAEHATRYQLMEGATQNSERLIEELKLELQSMRRRAITQEMQELAVGAGLLSHDG